MDKKNIILKRVKTDPQSIVARQPSKNQQQPSCSSTPINIDVTAIETSAQPHQPIIPCSSSESQQTAMAGIAGSSSATPMSFTPSLETHNSVSSRSSLRHTNDQNSSNKIAIPSSSFEKKAFSPSASPLTSNANQKQKFVILSNVLLSPPTCTESPQTLRAKKIYNLACQLSTSITNVPSLSPNTRNMAEKVKTKRTKIPQLLTPLSSSSQLLNQSAVSSKASLQLDSSMTPQTMRAHTILNLANSPSVGRVKIVPRSTPSLTATRPSNRLQQMASNPVVSSSSASSSLSNLQLEVLLQKKEDQIKNLQRLNKNKTMQLIRKEKEIETLQQELDKSIDVILEKYLDEPFLSVVKDHIKNHSKPAQAHRFDNQTKYFSQVIHFVSPKALKIMRHQFHICLPSESTISRLSCQWDFTNGFNPALLHPLQMATKHLSGKEKVVVVTLDEMAIDTTIAYDKKNDKVLGLESRSDEGFKMSKQALVFMVGFLFTLCSLFS